jgi:hypothetical protein
MSQGGADSGTGSRCDEVENPTRERCCPSGQWLSWALIETLKVRIRSGRRSQPPSGGWSRQAGRVKATRGEPVEARVQGVREKALKGMKTQESIGRQAA